LPGCSICTDRFEDGQGMRVLPCRHMFHVMCIDDWILKFSETCPLCRANLRTLFLSSKDKSRQPVGNTRPSPSVPSPSEQRLQADIEAEPREIAPVSIRRQLSSIARIMLGSRGTVVEPSRRLERIPSARPAEASSAGAGIVLEPPRAAIVSREPVAV